MKTNFNPILQPFLKSYFWLGIILYTFIHIGRNGYYQLPDFLNNYLTDFLCMPIILTLSLVGVRWIKRIPNFLLTVPMIFGMTSFYAVLFEFILPHYNSLYTADKIDALMYFTGATFYWFYWRLTTRPKGLDLAERRPSSS